MRLIGSNAGRDGASALDPWSSPAGVEVVMNFPIRCKRTCNVFVSGCVCYRIFKYLERGSSTKLRPEFYMRILECSLELRNASRTVFSQTLAGGPYRFAKLECIICLQNLASRAAQRLLG